VTPGGHVLLSDAYVSGHSWPRTKWQVWAKE